MEHESSLERRSERSVGWRLGASAARVVVLLVRAVALSRMLEVETFGVYAFAFAVVSLTSVVAEFGLGQAFLHRARETADEQRAARAHLGLTVLLTAGWAACASAAAVLLTEPPLRGALLVLTAAVAVLQLTRTPQLILIRRVQQRRLAVVDLATAVATTAVAVALAVAGAELWALLATDIVTAVVALVAFYVWRPVWRPSLDWTMAGVRYFVRFGGSAFGADALARALERIDNLWTGLMLGQTALGFYSRAFTFATYQRRLVAQPILAVVGGTYAELKERPERLREVSARVHGVLLNVGLAAAGALAVTAPELVSVVLGPRWMPMVSAFRILLVVAVLSPIERSLAALFVAVGAPGRMVWVRALQLAVVVTGLWLLGRPYGIAGVAAAVTSGLLVATSIQLVGASRRLGVAVASMAARPLIAVAVAAVVTVALERPMIAGLADVPRLLILLATFAAVFLAALAVGARVRVGGAR